MEPREALRQISGVLDAIRQELPTCDAQRAGAEMYGAPELSIFNLFHPNEVRLSRLLADLFDPKGSHGQGPLFLNAFLGHVGMPKVTPRDSVRVRREYQTVEQRRIDVVVETTHAVVGIENKPWAMQQPNQLADYHGELKRQAEARRKRFALVLLSDQPEKSAIGNVRRLPFYDWESGPSVREMLASTLGQIRAQKTRDLIQDFVAWIDFQFGAMTMPETFTPYIDAVEKQFESADFRKAIGAIMLAHDRLHQRVLDQVEQFILSQFRNRLGEEVERSGGRLSAALVPKWGGWKLRRRKWPRNCWIGIESERGDYQSIYYGIVALNPNSKQGEEHPGEACLERTRIQEAATQRVGQGRRADWWAWYEIPGEPNWTSQLTARLLVEAGNVEEHPEVQEFVERLLELAAAIDGI